MARPKLVQLQEITQKLNTIRLASKAIHEEHSRKLFEALITEVEMCVLQLMVDIKQEEQRTPIA